MDLRQSSIDYYCCGRLNKKIVNKPASVAASNCFCASSLRSVRLASYKQIVGHLEKTHFKNQKVGDIMTKLLQQASPFLLHR